MYSSNVTSALLPRGNLRSIPRGHLPRDKARRQFRPVDKEDRYAFNRRRLREAMDAHGWAQRYVAETVGVQPDYVSRVLGGKKGFTGDTARQWGAALGLPPHWFDTANGHGDETDLTAAERRLLGTYRALVNSPRSDWKTYLLREIENFLTLAESQLGKRKRK